MFWGPMSGFNILLKQLWIHSDKAFHSKKHGVSNRNVITRWNLLLQVSLHYGSLLPIRRTWVFWRMCALRLCRAIIENVSSLECDCSATRISIKQALGASRVGTWSSQHYEFSRKNKAAINAERTQKFWLQGSFPFSFSDSTY